MTDANLQESLLAWYRANRRDLPWRRTRDPYAIWISEAMLQQTRVETVLSYWPRFLERFPDVASLARAPEADVLGAWSGLGYYRRAKALRQAACAIVAHHGGSFPKDRASVLALPGIGRYTAGAVLSIAFGQREPLVDGNVARVLSRLFAIEHELGSTSSQRELWDLAAQLLPDSRDTGDWNQALMELGATICIARDPKCGACPLSGQCKALAENRVADLPRARPRPLPLDVSVEVLVVRKGAAWLFEQRAEDAPRMSGMWELPTRETGTQSGLFRAAWMPAGLFSAGRELGRARHTITRHRIEVRVREGAFSAAVPMPAEFRWIEPRRAATLGLTGMARKALALAT
ncbi:MAG TPA: A/G-specific adenine glycosylase [Planctomycetota bacterium]|nr:A/G-specific adenine glycosylase [Planctomycetota bacterium]